MRFGFTPMSEEAQITIVLLNYRRPQNIPVILEAIREQTVPSNIFLWNNGETDVNSALIDRYEHSDKNLGCMVRWKMAKEATTPYVMSLDDDICFNRKDALQDILRSLEAQNNPHRIIGYLGANFGTLPVYNIRREWLCRYANNRRKSMRCGHTREMGPGGEPVYITRSFVERNTPVDFVKGRVMAFRRENLEGLSLPDEREDDIFLNAALSRKARRFHRVPVLLNDAFYELPEGGSGNWLEEMHIQSRDQALKRWYSPGSLVDNGLTRLSLRTTYGVFIRALKLRRAMRRKFRNSP